MYKKFFFNIIILLVFFAKSQNNDSIPIAMSNSLKKHITHKFSKFKEESNQELNSSKAYDQFLVPDELDAQNEIKKILMFNNKHSFK
jgi:hypothetical protein